MPILLFFEKSHLTKSTIGAVGVAAADEVVDVAEADEECPLEEEEDECEEEELDDELEEGALETSLLLLLFDRDPTTPPTTAAMMIATIATGSPMVNHFDLPCFCGAISPWYVWVKVVKNVGVEKK